MWIDLENELQLLNLTWNIGIDILCLCNEGATKKGHACIIWNMKYWTQRNGAEPIEALNVYWVVHIVQQKYCVQIFVKSYLQSYGIYLLRFDDPLMPNNWPSKLLMLVPLNIEFQANICHFCIKRIQILNLIRLNGCQTDTVALNIKYVGHTRAFHVASLAKFKNIYFYFGNSWRQIYFFT